MVTSLHLWGNSGGIFIENTIRYSHHFKKEFSLMKSKIYNFITHANQLLLFVLAIALLVMTLSTLLSNLRDTTPMEVKVASHQEDNTTKGEAKNIANTKSFLQYIKDIYIIQLKSSGVPNSSKHESTLAFSSLGYATDGVTINLIFTKKNGQSHKLFPKDVYIRSTLLAKEGGKVQHDSKRLDRNIYAVIVNDTNGDARLNSEDKEDLFVSDYDGKNLSLVFKDIENYLHIADNQLLITRVVKGEKEFFTYDVVSEELTLLETKNH
jgi:hypothetical protein